MSDIKVFGWEHIKFSS